jgi:hypothetical protein
MQGEPDTVMTDHQILEQLAKLQMLHQFWLALFLLIPVVLISRSVVAGSRYSPILIIVIFGLSMGFLMVHTGLATPGLTEFPMVDLISKVTLIALIASFFVGGQELRRIMAGLKPEVEELVIPSQEEITLGTKRTQMFFIFRTFFILIGIESLRRSLLGSPGGDPLGPFHPLLAYLGLIGSVILIDYRATIKNWGQYIRKGLGEIAAIMFILFLSHHIAVAIKPLIALPQIFFAMLIACSLGAVAWQWQFGPTMRALLFAGIPVVLAANFMIGGSRIGEAVKLLDMKPVMLYGFFGQMFWMFGGLALLIFFGHANHVRNLAPGMAGSLSHAGLTGACTAGDLGQEAAARAPIMINVPFFGHIFVFTILAWSAAQNALMVSFVLPLALCGVILTVWSLKTLKAAEGRDAQEVKGLMMFSFGWQITAVFGGFLILHFAGLPIPHAAMATSSALSHFGLFAATQGGMFGDQASQLIAFIFAMPFLVHPLVFGSFGKAMESDGTMPVTIVYSLAAIGFVGCIAVFFV